MRNKLKVLVVGKRVGRSAAYEIAGTVSSEMNCECQADVEVKSISDEELKFLLDVLDDELYRSPQASKACQTTRSLIKKLKPEPVDEDE